LVTGTKNTKKDIDKLFDNPVKNNITSAKKNLSSNKVNSTPGKKYVLNKF
jgi:hypothetical protein